MHPFKQWSDRCQGTAVKIGLERGPEAPKIKCGACAERRKGDGCTVFMFEDEAHPWNKDHDLCVNRLHRHFKEKGMFTQKETKLCPSRKTDVYGYNPKTKTYYVCEVKVRFSDAQKAPMQLVAPVSALRRKDPGASVLAVLAVPMPFQTYLQKKWPENWRELSLLCRRAGIAIWGISYRAGARQIQGARATAREGTSKRATAAKAKRKAAKPTESKARVAKPKPKKRRTTRRATKRRSATRTGRTAKARRGKTSGTRR